QLVAACPTVTVLGQEQAASFAADAAVTKVTLASGRTLTANVLIAADGRRSPLREQAGIKTVGWSYGQTGITVAIRHDRPHEGKAVQHFLPGG
ncbi:FAD-dependent monooxygenase, partial [Vibrio parahaemolyticus]